MHDSPPPLSLDRLTDALDEGAREEAVSDVERFHSAPVDDRREALRTLRTLFERRPAAFDPLRPALTPFLTDEERSIRLRTAKLFVAVAEDEPTAVASAVPALATRLADDEEFYYVRARSAEALGYVALERPATVATPETLAELSVGLDFDESEVKEKLAKALEYVALGDPTRLRYRLSTLAERFGDESELVRYHLVTATAVVGCECPGALLEVNDALVARLDDPSPYVRGRAAEAVGTLARASADGWAPPASELAESEGDEPFVADRARFATAAFAGEAESADVGTVESIRRTTTDTVEEITSPDGACSNCGLALPEAGPPMCPQCGAPH